MREIRLYKGNSIQYWYQKACAYKKIINDIWATLQELGIKPDGKKTVIDAIKELAQKTEDKDG